MNAFGASALSRSPMSGGLLSGNGMGGVRPPPAPLLPAITMSAYDPETGTASLTVNEVGTIYYLVDNNASRLAAQVKAGGGEASGSFTVTAGTSARAVDFSIVPVGDHYMHLMLDDADENASAVDSAQYAFAGSPPAQMAAPAVTVTGPTSVSVDRAAAPAAGSDPITSYEVEYSTNLEDWVIVFDIADPQAITGLLPDTLHYFRTRAVSAAGRGAPSLPVERTTEASPSGPTYTPVITDAGAGSGHIVTSGFWTLRASNGSPNHFNYVSGQLVNTDTGSSSYADYTGTGTYAADQYVQADIVSVGLDTARLFLRYADANNYYRATVTGTAIAISKRVAGVSTTLVTGTFAGGLPKLARVDVVGSVIKLYLNGVQVLTATDTALAAAAAPGIGHYRAAVLDNVIAGNIT